MALWNFLEKGSKWTYLEPDLTGQGILGVWPAGERSGVITTTGGRLVLTEQALIFCPMDLSQSQKVLDLVIQIAQVPGADRIPKLSALSRDAVLVLPLGNIASAQQMNRAQLFKPPTVRIATKVGSSYDFGILAGTLHPNISPKNNDAVADFLAKLQPWLEA